MLGAIYFPIQQTKPAPPVVQSYAEGLTILGGINRQSGSTAPSPVIDLINHTAEWTDGVKATYGPTTITCDRLTAHNDLEAPYLEAVGHVKLNDPEGKLQADDLKFYWKSHTGSGHNVQIQLSMLRITAQSIDIEKDLWTLHNVGGTGCRLKTPLYYIYTGEMRITPGKDATVIHPKLSILGQRLPTLPTQHFSLSEGNASLDLPYPTYRNDRGFGFNWTNQLPLDFNTGIFTHYASFQRTLPFYNGNVIRSFVKGTAPEIIRTEIGDRLSFGYFDSVQVRDTATEQKYLKKERFDLGIGTTFGADADQTTTASQKINKPVELIGQASRDIGGFGAFALFRAQEVRIGNGPTVHRLVTEENILSPSLALGKTLSLFGRVDMAQFIGGNPYGWVRGQTGLVFQPSPSIRLGASYTVAGDHGTPDFAYDILPRHHEINLRTDLDFDTTQIRLLLKYDPGTRGIFDRELYFSRVVGCLEPYIVYRERPHKLFIGLKLPLTREFDRLSKDETKRRESIRNVISGKE